MVARAHARSRSLKWLLFLVAAFLLLWSLVLLGLDPRSYDKMAELRYRFELLERRVQSLGEVQADTLARYQANRGDAEFMPVTEPSPFDADGKWRLLGGQGFNGSWRPGHYQKTQAITVHDGKLYVGLKAPGPGAAAIWRYDGLTWLEVASAALVPGWDALSHVQTLRSVGDRLYAGVNDEVWVLSDGGWQQVVDPDGTTPWGKYDRAYSLSDYHGDLLVGLKGATPRVFRFRDGRWSEISDGLPTDPTGGVSALHLHTDGRLYAGTIAANAPGRVYRLDTDRWVQIGGGVDESWISSGSAAPLSFASYQDSLIVTLNRNPQIHAPFVSIWAFKGGEWHPVGRENVPKLWGETDIFSASIVYRHRLYVGSGGRPASNAGVWELSGDGWRQVAGQGVFGSWSPKRHRLSGSRHASNEYVHKLVEWRGLLIAGFGDAPGAAQIWAYYRSDLVR